MSDEHENDEVEAPEEAAPAEEDAMARLREQLRAIGLPRLAISGATVAAVGALVSFLATGDEAPAPDTVDAAPVEAGITLCHPDLFTTADGCTTMGALAGGEQSKVFSPGVLPNRPVTLIPPGDDDSAPREVSTCATFGPLKKAGWGGLTSADMRREAQLVRVCGLLALASRGQLTDDASPMTAALWARIDGASLPDLGELTFPSDIAVEEDGDPRVWTASTETMRGRFVDVGMADFDRDGVAEHLVEWTVVATGGTLAARGFGLVAPDSATFDIIDPFDD